MKSYTALGNFNAKLYHSLLLRRESTEWKHSERVATDRILERDRCVQLIHAKKEAIGTSGDNNQNEAAAKAELKSLIAHCNVLAREIEIDTKEKNAIQQSFEKVLLTSLSSFAQVLFLSQDNDLEIIFQVVNLWLSNLQNSSVADAIRHLITKCPTFKFVPLHYQIISRLGSINCLEAHHLLLILLITVLINTHVTDVIFCL